MGFGRNSNSSKLLLLSLLPARMMKIHSKMKALECSQHFSHYKSMEIFQTFKGRSRVQTLVQSCRISNPSKLLLLLLLPARIKKIQWKMEELECSQDFPHYNPMGAICCHRSYLTQNPPPLWCFMKFDYDRPAGLRDIHFWRCERTHGCRLESHPICSPRAFGSGELKKNRFWKNKQMTKKHAKFSSMQRVDSERYLF